jgi:hypothetical protein
MNPFGLRPAHIQDACSGRRRRSKTPPISLSECPIQLRRANSTRDCEGVSGYAKFTRIASGIYARAMQHHEFLFIFQKGIRAGIE